MATADPTPVQLALPCPFDGCRDMLLVAGTAAIAGAKFTMPTVGRSGVTLDVQMQLDRGSADHIHAHFSGHPLGGA